MPAGIGVLALSGREVGVGVAVGMGVGVLVGAGVGVSVITIISSVGGGKLHCYSFHFGIILLFDKD